jgi:hypothetical protein
MAADSMVVIVSTLFHNHVQKLGKEDGSTGSCEPEPEKGLNCENNRNKSTTAWIDMFMAQCRIDRTIPLIQSSQKNLIRRKTMELA